MPTDSVDVKELLEIQEKSFRATVQLLVDKQLQESKQLRQGISDLRMSLTFSQREIDDLKAKWDKLEKDNVRGGDVFMMRKNTLQYGLRCIRSVWFKMH